MPAGRGEGPGTNAATARRVSLTPVKCVRGLLIAVAALLLSLNSAAASAQESSDAPSAPATPAIEADPPAPADTPDPAFQARKESQRRSVAIGFLMLTGILVIGVILVCFVLLWSIRARRLARRPLPKCDRGDELWYLKPKRPEGADGAEAGLVPHEGGPRSKPAGPGNSTGTPRPKPEDTN